MQLHGGMVSLSQNPKHEASLQTQKDDQSKTLCILRTGLLCRDLLPCYGVRDIVSRRFYP